MDIDINIDLKQTKIHDDNLETSPEVAWPHDVFETSCKAGQIRRFAADHPSLVAFLHSEEGLFLNTQPQQPAGAVCACL